MATTTNFGWETPDDTDLVKDGAAAMRTLGNAIDTSFVDLKGGTTGQILSKASNSDLDYAWITNDVGDITAVTAGTGISGGGSSGAVTITNSMATAIDAKGDLVVGTGADTFDKLAVGSNGQFLTADSTTATGLKWATGGATFAGCSLYNSADITISNGVTTALTFDSENFDSDGYHSTTSNTSRITVPSGKAGKYLIIGYVQFAANATGYRNALIRKNGNSIAQNPTSWTLSGALSANVLVSVIADLAVSDYVELFVVQNSGGNLDVQSVPSWTIQFSATYLGA